MILDSNIIIYSVKPEYLSLARYLQSNQKIVQVSLISKLEVLGFSRLLMIDKLKFEAYLNSATILPITEVIIVEAIRLRQQRKRSLPTLTVYRLSHWHPFYSSCFTYD